MEMRMKKLLTIFGTSLVSQIITFVYGLVLPRLILEQYGSEVNGLIQSITQFLGLIAFLEMGVGQVVQSTLYKPLAQRDSLTISRILLSGKHFYRRIALVLLAYVAILMCAYPAIVDFHFGRHYIITLIAILSIGSFAQYYFGVVYEQLLHADQKSYIIYLLQIITNSISLLVCVWLVQHNYSIHALKLVTSIVFLIKPLIYRCYVDRNYGIDHHVTYTEEPIKQKWDGMAQHLSSVVLSSTDNVVLTIFSTLTDVSIYSIYYMVVSNIQRLYYTATIGIQAAAGRIWVKQDKGKIKHFFGIIEFGLHSITVFLFSCTGILIIPFVYVYTQGLADINYIQPEFAYLLILAYGVFCLRTPYNIWILAAGHFKQTQRCHITAAALNLIISVIAVSQWGLLGVAVGTLIAMCYQTTWMAVYTIRNLVKCSAGHLLRQCVADVVMTITICVAASGIHLNQVTYIGWFWMALKVAFTALACIALTSFLFNRKQSMQLLEHMLLRKM